MKKARGCDDMERSEPLHIAEFHMVLPRKPFDIDREESTCTLKILTEHSIQKGICKGKQKDNRREGLKGRAVSDW